MSATGTSQSQSETAFAFALVERQGKFEQGIQPIKIRSGFLITQHEVTHFRLESGLGAQLIDEIGIRQKSHVEDHVGIMGNAKLVTERSEKQNHTARLRRLAKLLLHLIFELVHVKIAG